MEEKPSVHPRGFPPHSARLPAYHSPTSAPFAVKREVPPSPSRLDLPSPQSSSASASNFSHDISRMPDYPQRNPGHRRAHSEIVSLPDDISFDHDLGFVGADFAALSDENEDDLFSMYIDMDKFASSSTATSGSAGESSSMPPSQNENEASGSAGERPRARHQHSQSMDGSTSFNPELLASPGPSLVETKKEISAAKLADLALVDPKRAKRIWANRQSAARSKERKMRYIAELERKVQTLQTEATTLSAQLTMLQRDTNSLTAENSALKLRLQSMEQQVHLQDALNDALREEVQRLKIVTGQAMPDGGQMNFSPYSHNQQFYHNPMAHTLLAAHQFQQLQIHSPHQPQPQLQHQHQQHSQTQQQQQPQQHPTDLKNKAEVDQPPPAQTENTSGAE